MLRQIPPIQQPVIISKIQDSDSVNTYKGYHSKKSGQQPYSVFSHNEPFSVITCSIVTLLHFTYYVRPLQTIRSINGNCSVLSQFP